MSRIFGNEPGPEYPDPLYSYSIQKWDTDSSRWLDEDAKHPCNSPEHGYRIMKDLFDITWHKSECGFYRMTIFTRWLHEGDFCYEIESSKKVNITKRIEWEDL